MIFSVDGSDVQYAGAQSENSPYICYSPSYGYAQSPYNPYNPYIPGASIGIEASLVGSQQYYSIPPYENIGSQPTYVPYVIQPSIMSNSSTEALLEAGTANAGRSGARGGSRHKNALATAGLSKNIPKSSMSNSMGRTLEKSRPTTGQSKQPGIEKSVSSAPASSHPFEGRDASVSSQPITDISRGKLLSSGQLEIAPPMHNGFPAIVSNNYKLRPKIYDGRGVTDANGNPDANIEQNRGPRTKKSRSQLIVKAYTTKAGNADAGGNIVINTDQYNKEDFRVVYDDAKFFVIKSYSEDDVHKSIKYGVWSSTPHGNKKLQSAYENAQRIGAEKSCECPVFLFFSVNASGLFCGVAEMTGPVAFDRDMDFWQQDKWSGSFPVKWHIIKDVPNSCFRHIILQNNENKPVTNSRDTQEIVLKQGLEMLKIFKDQAEKTSLLDDFMYYESRQRIMLEEKSRLLYRTFPSPFPVTKPVFTDGVEKIAKDANEKPSVMTTEEALVNKDVKEKKEAKDDSASTLKIGSFTITANGADSRLTSSARPVSTFTAPCPNSDQSSGHSKIDVAPPTGGEFVRVGSMPVKLKGSATKKPSPMVLNFGTIPLDPRSMQK
ncbi:PREDICTED: uncharacterized protein LOC104802611 isoform X2 [Tarenaya hassleriana]|nr:PREDICTED: uncharacterized protein LOC104802611 isoform X2 [Tarenaya hassleriana]